MVMMVSNLSHRATGKKLRWPEDADFVMIGCHVQWTLWCLEALANLMGLRLEKMYGDASHISFLLLRCELTVAK